METLSIFTQTFITLVEQIKKLKDGKIKDRKEAFEQIVDPIFRDVQPVIDNYFQIFQKAKRLSTLSTKKDLAFAVEEIRISRETMLVTRSVVREMAYQMHQIYNDKKIIDFSRKIDSFFYRTISERSVRGKSYAYELVDLFDEVLKGELDKAQLIAFIDGALKNMEYSWVSIAQSYASLRIYCLSKPKEVSVE